MEHFVYNRKAKFMFISVGGGGGGRPKFKILKFEGDILMWGRVKINLKKANLRSRVSYCRGV
jgi:hypothetical protein